jgi:transposase-like protein
MGQILHGSAKTTHAVRAAIQRSNASIQELASRYDLNPKTVMKWRKRAFLYDAPMGPKVPRSTVLSAEEEALAVPRTEAHVIRHSQERMPYGLFVPDVIAGK